MEAIGLSVVIACLDAEATLGAQLEALASQPCPVAWEVLVCDNGSTDGTVVLAESYRARLPLRVVDAAVRRGPGAARNVGVDVARGDWLAFCDADDVVAEDWLATMCTALERHAFVAGRFEGERLNSRRARRSRPLDQQDGLQSSAGSPPHAGAGNLGVHRKVFRAVGGFDPTVTVLEDTDLCWRIQRTGVPLVYVPDLVVHVRLRATLGAMYRQGVAYGRAHARLERRHAEAMSDSSAASPPASSLDPGDDPAAPTQRSRGRLEGWVGSPPSMARFVWQIGWHRGHRQGPDERPDPQAGTVAGRHRSNDDPE